MAKRISFEDSARPELHAEGVVFLAEADGKLVKCIASREAVLKACKAKVATDEELLKLFQTGKVKLREAAATLIRAGRVSDAGELLMRSDDLA
jgi:hypothetical protein